MHVWMGGGFVFRITVGKCLWERTLTVRVWRVFCSSFEPVLYSAIQHRSSVLFFL